MSSDLCRRQRDEGNEGRTFCAEGAPKKVGERVSWRPVRSCHVSPGERGQKCSPQPLWLAPKAMDGVEIYFRSKIN